MRILWTSAIASSVFLASVISGSASAISLYNGSGLPGLQGTLQIGSITSAGVPISPATGNGQSLSAGGVTVNTAANAAEYSGYSNYNPLSSTYFNPSIFSASTLNQATGYSLTFTVSLDSATSNTSTTNPRAVFSIIAISSDGKGIEIGFRANEIFAQSSVGFTSQDLAQTATFSTNTSKTYNLAVFNNGYTLSSGATPIINGSLLNYSFNPALSSPPLTFNPYTIPSFVFLGDDTGQESGTFTLGAVTLDTTAVPFEFSPTYGLVALGAGVVFKNWRKKAKDKLNK